MTQILNEAGLSRLLNHFKNRPVALISVSRSHVQPVDIENGKLSFSGVPVNVKSGAENFGLSDEQIINWNNAKLKIFKQALSQEGLSFIPVDGGYPEFIAGVPSDKEGFEDALFVIGQPVGDFDHFTKIIANYGKSFNQDSVFLKPADAAPFLLGTNNSDWPGYGVKVALDKEPSLFNRNVDGKLNGPHTDKSHGAYFTSLKGKKDKRFSFKVKSDDPNVIEKYTIGNLIYQCGGEISAIQPRSYFIIESYIRNGCYPYGKCLTTAVSINRLANVL